MTMKRLAILGSTGSIGINTLEVVRHLKGKFEVVGLSASSNIARLASQAREFHPKVLSVMEGRLEKGLKGLLHREKTEVVAGEEGLLEIVSRQDVDMVVFATAGNTCLKPLMKAIERKKEIALANKEALISAGEMITGIASANGVKIIPIDSEHSAIFQCMEGRPRRFLKKIYLTSSGGPLLKVAKSRFRSLSRESILKHPKWKMGKKITVDSATLMNKGLEIIEARWLFGIGESGIEVIVHPKAIVHSLVELVDGSVLAQLAVPDMKLPIQFALTFGERAEGMVKRLDLLKVKDLTFERPDLSKFPCLSLAREALKDGGTYPAVLNAGDEEAVSMFLNGDLEFFRIPETIEAVIARHKGASYEAGELNMEDVMSADRWAREEVKRICCL